MAYQLFHILLILILAVVLIVIGLTAKNKAFLTDYIFNIFNAGIFLTILGIGGAWLFSGAPILELATFKKYYLYRFGFDNAYLVGLSMLLAVPLLMIFRFLKRK